jgi:uncharacterized protein
MMLTPPRPFLFGATAVLASAMFVATQGAANAQYWQRPAPYYQPPPYYRQPSPPPPAPNRPLGIDCNRAYGVTERELCFDPDLGAADAKLKEAYDKALQMATNRDELVNDQRKWIVQRNQSCDTAAPDRLHNCILNAENQRTASLKEAMDRVRKEAADRAQAARDREAAEDAGYDRITFEDYLLDVKELQASERRIAVAGFYHKLGAIEELSENFGAAANGSATNQIFILTEEANRDFRALLLHSCSIEGSVCPIKVRGRVSSCTLTVFGKEVSKPCIIVESGSQISG